MFITNVWNFWRLSQYFWRLSGDLSENKRKQMKPNEQIIKLIFISFSMFYANNQAHFQAIRPKILFSYFIASTESL